MSLKIVRPDQDKSTARIAGLVLVSFVITCIPSCVECLVHGDRAQELRVVGTILQSENAEGLAGAAVGGRWIADGEVIAEKLPLHGVTGEPTVPLTDDSGSFSVFFLVSLGPNCTGPFGPALPAQTVPQPDMIELIIVHASCESTFTIDVNEANFVDPTAPDVLELREPILLPPCESGHATTEPMP